MNTKIAFVILHYYTIDDTIECVNSIQNNINISNYDIVVVDNGSPNKTGELLKERYKKQENIKVLINDTNLGFAKGNNIGFKYAKTNLKAEFIIMMNNDTKITQKNFIDIILQEYKKSNFAIMGPQILLPGDIIYHFNEKLISKNKLKKQIIYSYIYVILEYIHIYPILRLIKQVIKIIFKIDKISEKQSCEMKSTRKENVVLHGCFLIFSQKYIELFDGIDDRTFLYKEEQLLYIRAMKNNLKTVYNSELVILHNESSSTKAITKTTRKKRMLYSKNQIKSCKIVLKELKNLKIET